MTRCGHCGQHVTNYSEHLPMCVAVRTALEPDFWPGWVGHYRLDEAERAERVGRSHHGKNADKKRRQRMDAGIAR